jgi:hypothetical protein
MGMACNLRRATRSAVGAKGLAMTRPPSRASAATIWPSRSATTAAPARGRWLSSAARRASVEASSGYAGRMTSASGAGRVEGEKALPDMSNMMRFAAHQHK